MAELSRAYVELAHAIEQHQPHYIDGYYGPDTWRVSERRALTALAGQAEALMERVEGLPEGGRRTFLRVQVYAMQTTIGLLQGDSLPYTEEVRRLYEIDPLHAPERTFELAIARLDTLLPGRGTIAEREREFRSQFQVPPERLQAVIALIVKELRQRAAQLFPLPEEESLSIRLVQDEPWGAYNWYLGDYRSRIDFNTDLPAYLTGLPDLIAHEAYPGHHTEHVLKEYALWQGEGRGEHSILLINTPECVVSEGIATRALRMVMDDETLRAWLGTELAELAGVPAEEMERMLRINQEKRALRYVSGNAALLLHEAERPDHEVVEYLQTYQLSTHEEAGKIVEFLRHPTFRSYIFTYTVGGELLDQLFARGEANAWFGRLLTEPVTPGQIKQWLRESAPPE